MEEKATRSESGRRRIGPSLLFRLALGWFWQGARSVWNVVRYAVIGTAIFYGPSFLGIGPKTAPTVYYFFPDYRGGEVTASFLNGIIASIVVAIWYLPWLIGGTVLIGILSIFPPVRKAYTWAIGFKDRISASIAGMFQPVRATASPPPPPPSLEPAVVLEAEPEPVARFVRLNTAKRHRDFLNLCNVIFSPIIALVSVLALVITGTSLWTAATQYLDGNRADAIAALQTSNPAMGAFASMALVLILTHLLHRRILSFMLFIAVLCFALISLVYIGIEIADVLSIQLGRAESKFNPHDWSVFLHPARAHTEPVPGLLAVLSACGVCWAGWTLYRWGEWRALVVSLPSAIAGYILMGAGLLWLAFAAWPFVWPLKEAQDKLSAWSGEGVAGTLPLLKPSLNIAFAAGVGAIIFVVTAFVGWSLLRHTWLLTVSKPLTFASAHYPTPRKLWPHLLMAFGFSPSNYLSPHSWWTSTISHFLARTAGGISFWAFGWFAVASRKVITIPMFEDLLSFGSSWQGSSGQADPSAGPALAVAIAAFCIGIVLTLIGNRFRPRLVDTLSARQNGKPILFLRPFTDNRGELSQWHWAPWRPMDAPKNIGEALLDTAGCWGPAVSIGRPEDDFEPHGPGSIYVGHSDWRSVVADYAREASAVIVLLDSSEGLRWEINHLRERGYLHKSLFLFRTGASIRDAREQAAILNVSAQLRFDSVPIALVPSGNGWECWTGPKRDSAAIHVAIMRWFLITFGHPPGAWPMPGLPRKRRAIQEETSVISA